MKKTTGKLTINRETVRTLQDAHLQDIAGGRPPVTVYSRIILCDTTWRPTMDEFCITDSVCHCN